MKPKYDATARKFGKKISVYHCHAVPGSVTDFDVRMNDKGIFAAVHQDQWITAPSLKELQAALDAKVKEGGPTSWEYYIRLPKPDIGDRGHHFSRGGMGGAKAQLVLHYDIVKLSNVLRGKSEYDRWNTPKEEDYRLQIDVTRYEDGELVDHGSRPGRYHEDKDEALIPYTPKRWAALEEICARVRDLGARLGNLLAQDCAEVLLDRPPTGGFLLTAAADLVGGVEDE